MMVSRREFLGTVASLAALACEKLDDQYAPLRSANVAPGALLLFQGDSITAAGRFDPEPRPNLVVGLGTGYVSMLSQLLGEDYPKAHLRFLNHGVDGNTVSDLQDRWYADSVAYHPDLISLLVGVNDYWKRSVTSSAPVASEYRDRLDSLLDSTCHSLPHTRVVILEPFVLPNGDFDGNSLEAFDEFRSGAQEVALRHAATFVSLQAPLDQVASQWGISAVAPDGIHPTALGHAVIAREWRRIVGI